MALDNPKTPDLSSSDGEKDAKCDIGLSEKDLSPAEFLQAVTGGGLVNMVAIAPDGKPIGRTLRVTDNLDAISHAAASPEQTRNLYFALNEPRADLAGTQCKLCEEDFVRIRSLAVDLDPREEEEQQPGGWARERERLLSLASALTAGGPCPASYAVDTGNGVQLVWLFQEPIDNTREIRAAVKAQAAGLADLLGGDAVQSVDHLFRLPGTRNFPNAKKRAKGRTETRSRVLHADPSRRYSLDDLADLAAPRTIAAKAVDLTGFDYPAVLEAAEAGREGLSQALQARLSTIRTRRGFPAALENPDRSERDYALAAHCIGAGMTDPTEIACLVFALAPDRLFQDEGKGKGEDYAARTIGKALAQVKRDPMPSDFFAVVEGGVGAETGPERPKAERGFRLMTLGEIEDSDPEYLIDDLIETDSLAQIFGDPGAGKSFAAVDMAASVASGRAFHGRKVKQGAVAYVAGEGRKGLKRRFRAWGVDRGEDPDRLPLALSSSSAGLSDPAALMEVLAVLDAFAAEHGSIALIVVDTLARNFGGGDENDTRDMNRFVAALDRLKDRFPGCTVLVVHHTGHSDKMRARGAKALQGALDTEYRVDKTAETLVLTNTKMKEGAPPAPLHFRTKQVNLGLSKAGKSITSLVLEAIAAPHKVVVEKINAGVRLGLSTFAKAQSAVGPGSAVHLEAWRKAFYAAHTGDSAEAKRKAFTRARVEVVNRGYLSVVDDLYTEGTEAWPV